MEGRDIVRVLLVGDSPQSFSLSRQFLERSGCECHFAGSLEAAKDLLGLWQFDIVLSMRAIPGETIQKLVGLLSGSSVSLFSSLRIEERSWWEWAYSCAKKTRASSRHNEILIPDS